MPTVYLGTTDFAATVLEILAASRHRPSLVITRPDRPRGRGRRLAAPPVATAARRLGIEVQQPADVNDPAARGQIAARQPEAVCICAFGALIKEPLLSAHELFNVHPSLLPRWRGAAPVERSIDAGDERTGVAIMRPVAELDAGPVFAVREEPILPADNYGTLATRLARLGGTLLVQCLDERPAAVDQPADGATYAAKIEPGDRRLDPARTPAQLERRVRALTPHIGAHLELPGGEPLGVLRALPAEGEKLAAGALAARDGRLLFGAAGGALELCEVRPAGGRAMAAPDYLRGRGARLLA